MFKKAFRRVARNASKAYDRRVRLHDISRGAPMPAIQQSPIIQFYSSVDNIGNYTPVLGIHKMLGHVCDVWNVHCTPVDFDHINQNYRAAIIGGAGLLHDAFTPFWKDFLEHNRLPFIIWGVGGCYVDGDGDGDGNTVAPKRLFAEVATRAALVNVRDEYTAAFYRLKNAHISACPTIEWLTPRTTRGGKFNLLYASHTKLVREAERKKLWAALRGLERKLSYTDNVQRRHHGLLDILHEQYCQSDAVVTTRLHGAIIAAGLGIPYVALARDEKLRAFHTECGGGLLIEDVAELEDAVADCHAQSKPICPETREIIREFGSLAADWLQHEQILSRPRPTQ